MPDITFDSLESIPEGLRDGVKQADGKYTISVVPQAKLEEFRNNNINLSKERDTLKSRWDKVAPLVGEDIDAFSTTYQTLRDIDQQVKDGKLTAKGDIEQELTRRTQQMKSEYEARLSAEAQARAAAERARDEADGRFRKSIVERHITDAVLNEKSGAEPRALADIISRASSVFQVGDDGKLTAKEGDAIVYGADGATPMTPLEWLTKLREQAPYFFKQSTGGGANGGKQPGAIGGYTPEQFAQLPATKRLELARKQGQT